MLNTDFVQFIWKNCYFRNPILFITSQSGYIFSFVYTSFQVIEILPTEVHYQAIKLGNIEQKRKRFYKYSSFDSETPAECPPTVLRMLQYLKSSVSLVFKRNISL